MSRISFPIINKPVVIFLLLLFLIEPDGVAEAAKYNKGVWVAFDDFFKLLKWITIFAAVPMMLSIRKPSLLLCLMFLYNGIYMNPKIIKANEVAKSTFGSYGLTSSR